MENFNQKNSRHEILVFDLCEEIDMLRADRDYWKHMFEEERELRSKLLNENLESVKKVLVKHLVSH